MLELFHVLALVNSAAVNTGVQTSSRPCFQLVQVYTEDWGCWIAWGLCVQFRGSCQAVPLTRAAALPRPGPLVAPILMGERWELVVLIGNTWFGSWVCLIPSGVT